MVGSWDLKLNDPGEQETSRDLHQGQNPSSLKGFLQYPFTVLGILEITAVVLAMPLLVIQRTPGHPRQEGQLP